MVYIHSWLMVELVVRKSRSPATGSNGQVKKVSWIFFVARVRKKDASGSKQTQIYDLFTARMAMDMPALLCRTGLLQDLHQLPSRCVTARHGRHPTLAMVHDA